MSCPFCDSAQSYRYIKETDTIRAIYPKAPAINYHVLLVPKRHVQHFDGLSTNEVNEMFSMLQILVAKAKKSIPNFIGYNLLSNNGGPEVRQQVMHCHMHVFLRTSDDQCDPLIGSHSGHPPELTDEEKGYLKELQQLMIS